MTDDADTTERLVELEIKLAYQDHKIAALEALVRGLSVRLDGTERELAELKQSVASPEAPIGPHSDPPPHY